MPDGYMPEKKGIATSTLVLTVISVLIATLILKGCIDYLYSAILDEDDLGKFNALVDELSELPSGKSVSAKIMLSKGNAVIGIGSGADAFKCYGCPRDIMSSRTLVYEFPRSKTTNCGGDSCICRCAGVGQSPIVEFERYEITCTSIACRKVGFELLQRISLEPIFREEEITRAEYPYWENGFFYVRAKSGGDRETPFNGAGQFTKYKGEIFAYLEKEGNTATICPTTRCLS